MNYLEGIVPTKRLFKLAALALALTAGLGAAEDARPVVNDAGTTPETARRADLPTLYIAGDSTARSDAPLRGWGSEIGTYFDPEKINVVNRAIGGRSTRTFITDGRWDRILAELKPGDFVLVQFGHNDDGDYRDPKAKGRPSIRSEGDETAEAINADLKTMETIHSFGWYLRKFATDAKAKGATPILLSKVPHKDWKEGSIVRDNDRTTFATWTHNAAQATGALFVDANEIIAEGLERLGPKNVESLFGDRRTHSSPAGAAYNAAAVIVGLKTLRPNPLAVFFSNLADALPDSLTARRSARPPEPPSGSFVPPPPARAPGLGISGPGAVHSGRWEEMNRKVTASAVSAGLIPDLQPLIPNTQLRDTVVIVGGDGNYYLTGSSGDDIWDHNDGVELWRSPDLKSWTYVGLVWSFAHDATWQKEWRWHHKPVRALWAPELHYIKRLNNYFITLSMPPGGRGLLRSTTGKPEGPYVNALANDASWPGDIDASLFEDDDGAVYLVYGGGWIARMKDDLSGLAEEPRKPELLHPDLDPAHHAGTCPPRRQCSDIGHEGAFLFKRNGKYYLTAADMYEGRYSSIVAISDNIYGPYDRRHEAVPTGGGTDYFQDKEGRWWCGYFGNDNQAPFREKPAIVQVEFADDGTIHVAPKQPDFVLRDSAQAVSAPAAVAAPKTPVATNEILDPPSGPQRPARPAYTLTPGVEIPAGPTSLNWDSVKANFQVPPWLQDGKFGIFIHWGVYTVPAHHNEWYARHMYSNGEIIKWHKENFGPQDKFGYKDFIPLFKAEQFDASAWAALFRKAGARFVVPAGEHHDHFAMWDSKLTKWNAKQMGPKRDIIGELARSVRAEGLKFGISNHRLYGYDFMVPAKDLATDLYDPAYADFYGPPPAAAPALATQEFCNDWLARTIELIELYSPDFLWFDWDGTGAENPVKLQFAAYYFNRASQRGQAVAFSQKGETFPVGTGISSHEKGGRMPKQITPNVWMVDDVISNRSWSYVTGIKYRQAISIVHELCDAVSKNGTMMLNISPRSDGVIPPEQQEILLSIGRWLDRNGEAIYATRPWSQFSDGTDIRYTTHGDALYAICLKRPAQSLTLPALAQGKAGTIKTVTLLDANQPLAFTQNADGLTVTFPSDQTGEHAWALKITGFRP